MAHRTHRSRAGQHGGLLIEALIAIIIFSIGILGMVGLQATAVQQSSDARYRSEAAQLTDMLLGEMWAGDRTIANLQSSYDSGCTGTCTGYNGWRDRVIARLPGVVAATATAPSVTVDAAGLVTINVRWRAPNENAGDAPHQYSTTAQIQ